MEIDRTSAAQPPHIPTNIDTPPAAAPAARGDVAERHDRIELSDAAREVAQEPEDARAARIRDLRARVEAGTYEVDRDAVAKQILASADPRRFPLPDGE